MIPKECKRLAEVDFPIAMVSKHSAREKSIRHGHPSTFHLWWARRPLAVCRAMLLGLLLPDPCDKHCPEDFKNKARDLLPKVQGKVGPNDKDLQQALLKFIGDFSNWNLSSNQTYLEIGHGLVKAAHLEETPLVVDPFAGGGSIPLEALRLGCETFASDLNPVACLILKAMLEDIPRHGAKLAEELRRVGKQVKEMVEKQLAEFYPADPDGSKPIAYLWARTVCCEAPNCGAEIPLLRSFWLSKRSNHGSALRYKVIRQNREPPYLEFEIFEPKEEGEVPVGTVNLAKASCLCCPTTLPPVRVRAQLQQQYGGANAIFDKRNNRIGGARLLAVVIQKSGESGKYFRSPTSKDYEVVWKANSEFREVLGKLPVKGLSLVPDEPLPNPLRKKYSKGDPYFNFTPILNYGMGTWGDLFTVRQILVLVALVDKVRELPSNIPFEAALKDLIAISISRAIPQWCSLSWWQAGGDFVVSAFGRQALPIVWDFAEAVPWAQASGGLEGAIDWVSRVIEAYPKGLLGGQVQLADAAESSLPDQTVDVWFTDPPYYDAVPYADLSDFFFVWLKRSLFGHPLLRDPFDQSNTLTPKVPEIIDNLQLLRGVPKEKAKALGLEVKDRHFFENAMYKAFTIGRSILREDGIGCVVFAHKTTEGWEALLSGMIKGGWVITGSWPITTERPGCLRSLDSAALAASVHLIQTS